MPETRVVLYSRPGCHLCEAAREVVAAVCAQLGQGWREVDIEGNATLERRYGELLPVVTVDGQQMGYWWIDESRLRSALA